jgi:hypothetical protein
MKVVSPVKKAKGIYKFVINEDILYQHTGLHRQFENEWLHIEPNGHITVKGSNKNGYAWDGCSPKYNFFDLLLLGTPDGRINVNTGKSTTYYASLLHDILYQFKDDIGIERKVADDLFLAYLGDFSPRYLYYYAVRLFGGWHLLFKKSNAKK